MLVQSIDVLNHFKETSSSVSSPPQLVVADVLSGVLTKTTSTPVSRYAQESPTLAITASHPLIAATVAVVPETCTGNTYGNYEAILLVEGKTLR